MAESPSVAVGSYCAANARPWSSVPTTFPRAPSVTRNAATASATIAAASSNRAAAAGRAGGCGATPSSPPGLLREVEVAVVEDEADRVGRLVALGHEAGDGGDEPLSGGVGVQMGAAGGRCGGEGLGERAAVGGGGADERCRVGAGVDAVALRLQQPGRGELPGGERGRRGLVHPDAEERSERAPVGRVEGGADDPVELAELA